METLDTRIAELAAGGADRHDPVRFRYIRALVARARGKPAPIADPILEKALVALDACKTDFDRARLEAETIVDRVSTIHPDAAHAARRLFETGDFRGVHRFARQLDRRGKENPLSALIDRIRRAVPNSPEETVHPGIDALMRRQEAAIVASGKNAREGEVDSETGEKTEMLAVREFREMLVKLQSDRLVNRALRDRPESPGPLNARMLAIRSLAALRQLSPAYLSRFVIYIDTLVRLQQAGDEFDRRKGKKRAGG